jgi:plastocyanin
VCTAVAATGSPAVAATTGVTIQNFGFHLQVVTIAQGDTVRWTQKDAGTEHTSTSDQGFWHSPKLMLNETYSQTAAFENAGSYPYHCAIHTEMTGRVRVPMKAGGSASAGWTLRWSSLSSTPTHRAFDVQIKRPGSTSWAAFRTDTKTRHVFFNPAHNGTYSFRARTRNLSNGKRSAWSPVKQVKIS